jgi:hypothetical protein
MGNEVAAQAGTKGLSFAVPAHIAARIKAAGGGNIPDKNTTNSITFAKKIWEMHINGESKPVTRPDPDTGELENVQILRVVVVDWNQVKERAYYEGNWTGQGRQPDCWSPDGKKPHASVENPQGATCETCPMSFKGSLVKDGKEMVACGQNRILVVIPEKNLDYPAMRMKLAVTSDWDAKDDEAVANGWYAWKNYVEFLRANGLDHSGAVVTQMRFANTNWPKVQFKLAKFLEEEEFDKVLARSKSEEVQKLLAGFNPAPKPQGKPLPKDEEPAQTAPQHDPLAELHAFEAEQKLRVAEEAEAAKHAAAAAEAKAAADAAAAKAKKIADAKAALAALEAEEGGFDDGPIVGDRVVPAVAGRFHNPPAPTVELDIPVTAEEREKKRTRRTKAEMDAARAAEAAAKAPPTQATVQEVAADLNPLMMPSVNMAALKALLPEEPVTTASLGGPVEIPAALAAALPAWD